ncbi:hypothetical protein EPO15_06115 [bacterium]|nr:MAG: hypothetical protein EPO15_06115 [bacterium]
MRLLLAALLAATAVPARAGALRHAALAMLSVRENPTAEGRRAALDVAFDAADDAVGAGDAVPASVAGPRRTWFPRKGKAAPAGEARLRVPELPAAPVPTGLLDRAATALGAAFAPWRALAEAAWGGTWSGMVAVGQTGDPH